RTPPLGTPRTLQWRRSHGDVRQRRAWFPTAATAVRGSAYRNTDCAEAVLMARVGRYGIPAFVWFLIWLVVCILVVILLALLIHHLGGASLTIKLGHLYLNIGVT